MPGCVGSVSSVARTTIRDFAEIQLICPLEICRQRGAAGVDSHAPSGIDARAGRCGSRVLGVAFKYELARVPELMLDTKDLPVEAAAAEIVSIVTTRFLHPRAHEKHRDRPPVSAAHSVILLDDGTPEQKEISRRAREYPAERLRGATR